MAVWHKQTEPSDEWVITHNLGRIPFVQVMTDDYEVVTSSVVHLTEAYATVAFNEPRTGNVLLM